MAERWEHTLTQPRLLAFLNENTGQEEIVSGISGAIDVHVADVHTIVVNELVHLHTAVGSTIGTNASAGDVEITLADATGFVTGDEVQVGLIVPESDFFHLVNVVGNVITLNRPLDSDQASGITIDVIETNMATTVGTLASPIAYRAIPEVGATWHITSFILTMTHSAAADDSKFGDKTALTNGVVLRGYSGLAGRYQTLTHWRSNRDIKLDMFDVPYTDKAGGGLFGVNGNGAIQDRTGAVPHLNGDNGDFIEVLIQDDLTSLASFKLKVQGHYEGQGNGG